MNELVLLTGAGGFLGTHLALALLRAGYHVRASSRDPALADARFASFVPETLRQRLSFVKLDLSSDEGWREAAEGSSYVVHSASPVPSGPVAHEREVIEPAREGTLRALQAARSARVRRVVVTSSIAAVIWGHSRDGSRVYDEGDWSRLDDSVGAYEQSKTLAERAAWQFVEALPAEQRFELVTVLPGAIVGPLLDARYSVSGQIVRAFLARDFPGVFDLGFALSDVRDVAEMHVAPLTSRDAAGQRFIVAGPHTPLSDVAEVLETHCGPRGFRVPKRRLPNFVVKLAALWNASAALTARELGKRQDVSSRLAREVLGFRPRSVETMIVDMADSMMAHGVVAAPKP